MDEKVRSEFRVPEENLPKLKDGIALLNRRARRVKVAEIEMVVGTPEKVPITKFVLGENKVVGYRQWFPVTIVGDNPKIAGWVFVATLQHTRTDAGEYLNILRTVPGYTIPERYRTGDPVCEYCNLKRHRRDTYVLWSEYGEYKEVGSDCIKDFLGGVSPEQMAVLAEILALAGELGGDSENDEWGGGGRGVNTVDRKTLLAFTAAAIREEGWVSRKEARNAIGGKIATVDRAMEAIFPPDKNKGPWVLPNSDDDALATEALEWAEETLWVKINTANDDYLWNLRVALSKDELTYREVGIAASLIPVFLRAKERAIKRREASKKFLNSTYQGEVGKRAEFKGLRVTFVLEMEDRGWGPSTMVKFLDADGNVFVWFASAGFSKQDMDKVYDVKGTVKKHDTRDGIQQTQLTRVKILREVTTGAAQAAL